MRTLWLTTIAGLFLTCGTGCLTATVWNSWEGHLGPWGRDESEIYTVADKAFLFPVTLRELPYAMCMPWEGLSETVKTVWFYVPDDLLEQTAHPDVWRHRAADSLTVTGSEARQLRNDQRARRLERHEAEVRLKPYGNFKWYEIVVSIRNAGAERRRIVLWWMPEVDYHPWWRWPARVALTPPAVAGDIALTPFYLVVICALLAAR